LNAFASPPFFAVFVSREWVSICTSLFKKKVQLYAEEDGKRKEVREDAIVQEWVRGSDKGKRKKKMQNSVTEN
jgi:hypothetical protein